MPSDWIFRGDYKAGHHVRTLAWDELQTFKSSGELPEAGRLPGAEPPLRYEYNVTIPSSRRRCHLNRPQIQSGFAGADAKSEFNPH